MLLFYPLIRVDFCLSLLLFSLFFFFFFFLLNKGVYTFWPAVVFSVLQLCLEL